MNVSQDQQPSVGVNWLRRHKDVLGLVGLSLLGGAGLFILLYGTIPVVFSNLDWVYASQDSLQHFLGWQFFRNAPWTFPLGAIPAYGTPYGVTLTYTDSIPLLAIGLKLFNGLLKQRFQYLGLWTLMCFILQFLFGGLILREFTPRILPQVLGAALLVLAPPLLFRTFYHTSLVSQWLVLLAIYLLLLGRRKPVGVWPWALTAVLAVTIHPYFLPMVLPLFVVALVERFQRERQLRPLLWQLLVVLGITALAGYAIGVFALGSDNLASSGFGTYSTNLNALFNSFGTSQFVRALPVFHYHQDEGYSYLGLGLLGVVGLALISLGVQRAFRNGVWQNRYLLGLCAGWTLFSLSTTITWNEHVLLSLALPDALGKLSGMFRASGRFFWPVFYLLVIFALVRLIQKVRFAPLILACALAVQLLDLQPLIQGKRFEATQDYTSPLTAAFWDSAANTFKHVMILPAFRQTNAYAPFAIFAATHGQTLNWGYFARANYAAIQAYGQQETQNLIGGKASADTLYVFCQISDVRQIAASPQNQLAFYNIDSYFLGYPQSHPLAQPATPWAQERVSMEQIEGLSLKSFLQTVKPSEIVFLTGRGMPFEGLDADTRAQLRAAGLKNEFAPDSQDSYIAGWGQPLGGAVLEQASGDKLDQVYAKYQQVGDLAMPFDLNLRSAGQQAGNYASVQMNLKEYSHNKSGLNVLIYNTLNGWVKSLSFTHGYRVVCP